MVLLCIEVKRFEERKHVFLHVAIATDGCNVVGRHNFLTQKLEAKIVGMVSPRFSLLTIQPQICTAWCTKLQKHFDAVMKVFCCFTSEIVLPGDASDYNEDKKSVVAARMQNKVIV